MDTENICAEALQATYQLDYKTESAWPVLSLAEI